MLFRQCFDWLVPLQCARCRARGAWACARCVGATPTARTQRGELCVLLAARHAHALLVRALYALKYHGARDACGALAAPLARAIARELGTSDGAVLVPVPTDPRRARQRGYDQAVLLARSVAAALELPCWEGLLRTRPTRDQVGLGRRARIANLDGSFRASTPPTGLLLVCDDVCTTGATLASAVAALRAAGATRVLPVAVLGATGRAPAR